MAQKSNDFIFNDRKLQVRATPDSEGWKVRVFENGKAVTGVVYTVSHDTQIDTLLKSVPEDLVETLMQIAQSDVENGRVKLA